MSTATASQSAAAREVDHVTQTREFPRQLREAVIEPATFDEAARTVEVVFTRGARVKRYDYMQGRRYEEELVVTPEAVDMSRFDAGAVSVLDSHQSWELANVIGVAVSGRIANGEGRATLRLSERPELAGIVADIKAGVIRNISVGYSISAVEIIEPEARADGGALPLYRATRWQPMEISFVPIPADAESGTRSADDARAPSQAQGYPCTVKRAAPAPQSQEQSMTQAASTAAERNDSPAATQQTIDEGAVRAAAETAAAERAAEIIDLCQRSSRPELAKGYIQSKASLDAVRKDLLDKLFDEDQTRGNAGPNVTRVQTLRDETQTRRAGMEAAILHRMNPGSVMPEIGNQFRQKTLCDLLRVDLQRAGVSNAMELGNLEVVSRSQGYMSTSDFSSVLANVANKALRQAYEQAPATYKTWARRGENLRDFKPVTVAALSGAPNLLPVNEHGEFKTGSMTDAGKTYQATTAGRIVALTRQAIVNDDLNAFSRLLSAFGSASSRYENATVYALLTANGNSIDGSPIFGTTRTYVDTATNTTYTQKTQVGGAGAGVLGVTALGTMRAQMRLMRDPNGIILNIAPSFLIVPGTLETSANQFLSANYVATQQSNINPFATGGASALQLVVEPMLDATSAAAFYVAANSASIDTVEYRYLDGFEGPVVEQEAGFDTDGMRFKCRLDFAAEVIDYRGLQYSTGV